MKSPASIRASNAAWRATSSAERTAFGTSSRSLPIVSIACVYMAFLLFRTLVDDAPGLADKRALQAVGQADVDRRIDADQRLDAVTQPLADRGAVGAGVLRQHFAADLDRIEVAVARDDGLVLPRELAVTEDDLLDLGREQVDAADDQHVVAAADDLAHAPHRARRRRQEARQVARAIADDRQRLLGERREHELAFGAVGKHRAGVRIDDLGIE